jgi:hypothetical protein
MELAGESTCDAVIAAQRLVPALNTWQIIAILSSASTREEAVHWLIKEGCQRQALALPADWRFRLYLPRQVRPNGGYFFKKLDSLLDGRVPVALAFNAKRFLVGDAHNPKVKDVPHAAMIVGREFRDGACKYLVRNSFGPGCEQYAKPYSDEKNCENGSFWITEKDFNETVKYIGAGS